MSQLGLDRIVNVFVSPTELFPKAASDRGWVLVLLLSIAVSAACAAAVTETAGYQAAFTRTKQEFQRELDRRKLRDKATIARLTGQFEANRITAGSAALSAAQGTVILCFLSALMSWVLGTILFARPEVKFLSVAAVFGYSSLFLAFSGIIGLIGVAVAGRYPFEPLSLRALGSLFGSETEEILGSINLIEIWWVGASSFGVAHAFGVSRRVLVPVMIAVLLMVKLLPHALPQFGLPGGHSHVR